MPAGFLFPAAYLEVIDRPELPELMPWWFLAENERLAVFWRGTLRQQFPNLSLVPFAKFDTSDDLACFDGGDVSGNPAVLVIHAYTTPGWEHRRTLRDFEAWMAAAAADARAFAAAQA